MVVSNIFYFHPYLGKITQLTNIFQRGWNHQLGYVFKTLSNHFEEESKFSVGGSFLCPTFFASKIGTGSSSGYPGYPDIGKQHLCCWWTMIGYPGWSTVHGSCKEYTLPATNMTSSLKIGPSRPKRKRIQYSNHPFSGANLLASFQEVY